MRTWNTFEGMRRPPYRAGRMKPARSRDVSTRNYCLVKCATYSLRRSSDQSLWLRGDRSLPAETEAVIIKVVEWGKQAPHPNPLGNWHDGAGAPQFVTLARIERYQKRLQSAHSDAGDAGKIELAQPLFRGAVRSDNLLAGLF